MSPYKIRILLGSLCAFALIVAVSTLPHWWNVAVPASGSAPAAIGGPFTLVDQTGRTVTDADYRGKVMLVYFGYTSCPDLCPTTLATLSQVLDHLKPDQREQLAPLFITVDPERDTPKRMAEYVGAFSPALIGLTGSPEQIVDVEKAYRIYARKADLGGGNYGMDHSSILYVMGRDGRYLDHLDPNASAESLTTNLMKVLG